MIFQPTTLPGVLLGQSPVYRDDRGFFTELYSDRQFRAVGLNASFVQDNLSLSAKGVLRGMHYQIAPHAMGKLVRVLDGAVFDVAIDLRAGSPTFGQWTGHTLSAENGHSLWIPGGFAHGFLALEDDSRVFYKCTAHYEPAAERAIRYDDPAVGIQWPQPPTIVSEKDIRAPLFARAEHNFIYEA